MTRIGRKIGFLFATAAIPAMLAVPVASAQAGGYRHHSYYHYNSHHHYHHDGHGNGLAYGILGGIIGLAVGSAIADSQSSDTVVVRERTPVWHNPDSDYGYRNYGYDSGWYQPPPQPVSQQQPVAAQDGSCMQTREYQTRITVGGKDVDAYGTACLQPDGSWKFGAPTPVPQ